MNDLEVVIENIENVAGTEIENAIENVIVKEKEIVTVIGNVIIVNRIPEKDHAAERETVIEREIGNIGREAEKKGKRNYQQIISITTCIVKLIIACIFEIT